MIFGQINIAKMSVNSEMALKKFILENDVLLMAIQETGNWNHSANGAPGYSAFHKAGDLNKGTAGVALLIHPTLEPEPIYELNDDDEMDTIWCQIKIRGKRHLVGSVYCKPSQNEANNIAAFKNLTDSIDKARTYKKKHNFNSLLIYGDYNARHSEWGDHETKSRGAKLLEYVQSNENTKLSCLLREVQDRSKCFP